MMDFLYSPRDEQRVFQQLKISFKELFLAGYLLHSTAPCLNVSHHRHIPAPLLLSSSPGSHPPRSSPLGRHGHGVLRAPCATQQIPPCCFTCGKVHVSVRLSQFIPPSASHSVPAGLFLHCCPADRFLSTILLI